MKAGRTLTAGKFILITDKGDNGIPEHPECQVMSATDFIAKNPPANARQQTKVKVINLCNSYDYLGKGYYVSLLAEARGMRCVPSVTNIVTLNWKRHHQASLPELNGLLEKHFKEPAEEPLSRSYMIYFGRIENVKLDPLARRLFDLFRFPLMTVGLKFNTDGKWVVDSITPLSLSSVPREKHEVLFDALNKFTGVKWRSVRGKKEKHWLAIMHDPAEKIPPSNAGALKRFAKVGKDLGLFVEFITRQDMSSLLEYDALFIRETTAINNHTYSFAHKAESENIPCIDDTQSIIRCCNKVFQHELLRAHKVPLPATLIIDRKTERNTSEEIRYPAVMKIPDGAFSRGVIKVDNEAEFLKASSELLKKSEIIICQEYVPSEFDWRIGVLNGEALFACKYYMAPDHWQIYNHGAKRKNNQLGYFETLTIAKVPAEVLKIALKATKLIGDGLYGVDLKQTEDGIFVMEVNDNPTIDYGVEDQVLGDHLYRTILSRIIDMIEE